jgi:hypothetical protein
MCALRREMAAPVPLPYEAYYARDEFVAVLMRDYGATRYIAQIGWAKTLNRYLGEDKFWRIRSSRIELYMHSDPDRPVGGPI